MKSYKSKHIFKREKSRTVGKGWAQVGEILSARKDGWLGESEKEDCRGVGVERGLRERGVRVRILREGCS